MLGKMQQLTKSLAILFKFNIVHPLLYTSVASRQEYRDDFSCHVTSVSSIFGPRVVYRALIRVQSFLLAKTAGIIDIKGVRTK
jgi:hypothetical protein